MDQHQPPEETQQPSIPPPKPSDYTAIRSTPDNDQNKASASGTNHVSIEVNEFDELTKKARQRDILLTERKAFLKVFSAIEAMPDHWAQTMRNMAREAAIQASHELETLVEEEL